MVDEHGNYNPVNELDVIDTKSADPVNIKDSKDKNVNKIDPDTN